MRLSVPPAGRFIAVLMLLAAVTATRVTPVAAAPVSSGSAAAPAVTPGAKVNFDLKRLDPTCAPCTDFFRFATGGWEKTNPIPPEYPSWDSFGVLQEQNEKVLHGLLESAAADVPATQVPASDSPSPQGIGAKLGMFYRACMDEPAVEAAGIHPLDAEFAKIEGVTDVSSLSAEIAHLEQGVAPGVPFDFSPSADPKDSSRVIGDLGQDGLTLPERDYYVNPSPESKKIRDRFVTHVAAMFALAGDDATTAATEAATTLAFETELATASFTNVQLRDVAKTTNHYTVATLQSAAPNMGWATFFSAVGAPQTSDLNVDEPSYFKAVDALLASEPIARWKTYLRWKVLNASASALPKAFVDEEFAFDKILSGTPKQQPRWKRCVSATNRAMDEAVGELYVHSEFSAAAKARALQLVDNVQATLRSDLTTLPWMSASTRKTALEKIVAMRKKIGYPDKVRDYGSLVLQPGQYLADRYLAAAFNWAYQAQKIGKPTERTEWGFPAQTVNAQYDPTNNDVTFPAGILQPPFYNVTYDDALNYGAIGAVIGHEMTHGFDDQGRLYDPEGNQTNWWTPGDVTRFDQRTKCVSSLYDTLRVDATLKQRGALVLGEAIADLGGTTIAFKAFERAQAGKPRVDIQGYTPEQRFFLAYANVWAENIRPQAARLQAATDVHALGRNRVVGTLVNMPEFAAAWHCPLRAAMVRPPASRCSIW